MKDFASIRDEVMNGIENRVKQAYNAGYKVGANDSDRLSSPYHKGLEEAWECAKKIYNMSAEKIIAIFGSCSNWVNFTATEAIAKIKEYEEKQNQEIKNCATCKHVKKIDICLECEYEDSINGYSKWEPKEPDNEIRVGDEVYLLDENRKSVVTYVDGGHYAVMICQSGKWSVEDVKKIHKTGKHFDEIEKVLNLLKGGTP